MHTPLLSHLAPGQSIRRLLGAALSAGLLLAAPVAGAQTIYGLGTVTPNGLGQPVGAQGLIIINPVSGASNTFFPTQLTGVTAGQTLVGIDYRSSTGQLYGLGYNAATSSAQLYTINPGTNVVTPVAAAFTLGLGTATDRIGFDFNPVADRFRVVSTNDSDYRLNPDTGALVATDGTLAYAIGDPNTGLNPGIGAVAYTNSFAGSTATTLYDIDELNSGILAIQNPPNSGTLNTVATISLNGFGFSLPRAADIDIYYNPATGQNEGFLTEVTAGGSSNFYRLNLTTGAATLSGNTVPAAIPFEIRDIAAAPAGPVTGQLLYAISGTQLISIDSDAPGITRSTVALGAPSAGETLAGIDFRPATGELFALGYNSSTNSARLYTINRTTGALTAIGGAPVTLLLGGASDQIGFDFNPTVDRIRVVSTNGGDYRLNPINGAIAATDGTLTAGPVISGAAYTNNQSAANTTTLYDYDATNAQLYIQNPPNNGTLILVGPSGITPPTAPNGSDFDIFNTPNTTTNVAFLAVNAGASTTDNLYTVDLATGTATLKGQIGTGSNITGLAAFVAAGTAITWNGSTSTAWGTAANWTPAQVPTANNDVTIPSGTPNQPTVSNAQQARLVTLTTGAVLTLANGGTLSTGGSFTNNGGSVAGGGTGTLALGGTASVIGGTSLSTFPNLSIANTASTGGPVAVQQALTLNGNLTVGAGQAFTLLSSASGTAYVVNNGTAALTGTATVQRYIDPSLNAGTGYRHYSAPVTGSTVADLATASFSPVVNPAYNGSATPGLVTPFPTVFAYDQTRTALTNPMPEFDRGFFSPAATGDALEPGRGYTVNLPGSALVDFVGALNNGAYSRSNLSRGTQPTAGYHLLGNPYPSALDWTQVAASGLSGVDNALYVFKSSGQYTGSYASYVNGLGTNGGTNVIPLAQGFFVRTSTAGSPGAVSFANSQRITTATATPFQRTTVDTRPRLILALALANATSASQTAVYFEQGATAGFDSGFDANYIAATSSLTLATETAAAEALAINGQPALTGADVVLPLRLAVATAGTYTLRVDELADLPTGYHAYLRDALTGTYTDLATTPRLSLTLAANGAAAGRYAVVFSTQNRVLATANAALAQLASVYPNPAHGTATLLLPVALRGTQPTAVSVVDNLGRTVLTRTLAAGSTDALELPLTSLAPGVYSVQARTAAGVVAKRLVVE